MKHRVSFLTVLLSALVAFGVVRFMEPASIVVPTAEAKESAFDRMMRTNKLRCGYYLFPPVAMRDPNTGEMSGLTVDMMNVIAEKTGLEIEWAEESTFGNWIPALQAGRYDAMCAPMWPDMALAREVIFTRPLYYAALAPLVREDDTRFDGPEGLAKLNSPEITIVAQDGNTILHLAKKAFPKAKIMTLAANVDGPSVVQNVVTKKADALILDRNGLMEYNKRGFYLKMIHPESPVKGQPFVLPLQHKETELREFLDNAIMDLLDSGTMARLLDKWEAEPGKTFMRVAVPYENGFKN
ncbi:MAG: substrate-binding periplasmic protein [Bdellovibrionales bacterium]